MVYLVEALDGRDEVVPGQEARADRNQHDALSDHLGLLDRGLGLRRGGRGRARALASGRGLTGRGRLSRSCGLSSPGCAAACSSHVSCLLPEDVRTRKDNRTYVCKPAHGLRYIGWWRIPNLRTSDGRERAPLALSSPLTQYAHSGDASIAYQVFGSGSHRPGADQRPGVASGADVGGAEHGAVLRAARLVRPRRDVRPPRDRPVGLGHAAADARAADGRSDRGARRRRDRAHGAVGRQRSRPLGAVRRHLPGPGHGAGALLGVAARRRDDERRS